MQNILQDLRYGLRMLVKTPVVSGVAALSLALGIAAATAMFALASGFWLEPLPFGDQDGSDHGAGAASRRERGHGGRRCRPQFPRLAGGNFHALSAMTALNINRLNVTGHDMPEEIAVADGTPNMFDVLQVQPALGRGFRPEEGAEGSQGVAVITHQYWERRFDLDPDILGRALVLDGTPHTIVGVMPEGFEMLPAGVEAFRPTEVASLENRAAKGWLTFGRLRPGATLAQARSDLTAIQARLETEYPEANRGWGVLVQNARQWFPGPTDAKLILLLVAVSLFGVAIASANVANLLLSRAETRLKEVAVRTALGAGRVRILRQLLTESLLLGLLGGGVGTLLSMYVIRGLDAAMPAELPQAFRPTLDLPTLLATLGIALATGILFGLAPALHATRGNLKDSLGHGGRGGTAGRSRKRLRSVFVVGQIAVALALLTGAGELRTAMNGLVFSDNGFNAEGILTFQLSMPGYKYADLDEVRRGQEEILRALKEIPGVQSATSLVGLPRGRNVPSTLFSIEGQVYEDPNQRPRTNWDAVGLEYLETLQVPLVSGRWFQAGDREDAPLVAVVNQEFQRRYFPDRNAIGKRIELRGQTREIVGVVQDYIQRRIPLNGIIEPGAFLPAAQDPIYNISFMVRAASDPANLASDVRNAVWSVDPDQPVAQLQTLQEYIDVELAAPRFLGLFVGALEALAVFLSAMGIYGVMSHTVLQERREMGIRMAVGARAGQLVGMVTRRGLALTAVGMALGVPMAFLLHRGVMSALSLFDADLGYAPAVTAGAVLLAVAVLATYLPARAAAKVQPTRVLSLE